MARIENSHTSPHVRFSPGPGVGVDRPPLTPGPQKGVIVVVTSEQLSAIMPNCKDPDCWAEYLLEAMERYQINAPARASAFLAQIAVESGECDRLVENLNYSAGRLLVIPGWKRHFKDIGTATQYAHNPEKLGNYVYADIIGNGPESSGDGYRYRGRGLIQITGRANYRLIGEKIGLPLEDTPEIAEQPEGAALTAAYFWKMQRLNELADRGDESSFRTITSRINAAMGELNERLTYWARAKKVLVS